MKTIELVFLDAGGGHRNTANALCEMEQRGGQPGTMRMTNLEDVLSELDFCRRLTGASMGDIYNGMLRRGWTLGSPALLRVLHGVLRLTHHAQVDLLKRHWSRARPGVVVSLVPNFNRVMYEAIQQTIPEVPFVTVLTDLADYPPHFWVEVAQRQYFICGTDRAHRQVLGAGYPAERVFRTSGMIVSPRFYDPIDVRRARDIPALGLDPALPVAMMMFGGEGSAEMARIARLLDESDLKLQLIAVCGRNAVLESEMRTVAHRIPVHVTGFTRDVPRLMRLSDFFIGKPGPGSISEAVAMGLPVIVERNHWTLPQERYNADWVESRGLGICVRSFRRGVVDAARRMLDPRTRRQMAERARARRNRAVFEVPEILAQIAVRRATAPVPIRYTTMTSA
ncbi:MAG: glycosyltransferase [Gemmatimonadales bacterium]